MDSARISHPRELRLNRKQRLYVAGVAAGKSRRRAALDAGYSLSSANNPAHNIERGRGREVFAELIRTTVPRELTRNQQVDAGVAAELFGWA